MENWKKPGPQTNPQGVVKHDWLPTGRIDFTARFEDVGDQNKDKPGEFKLLVEERRIVESIAGNENLEIQWRLATLSEAKAVVTHIYLKTRSSNPFPRFSHRYLPPFGRQSGAVPGAHPAKSRPQPR